MQNVQVWHKWSQLVRVQFWLLIGISNKKHFKNLMLKTSFLQHLIMSEVFSSGGIFVLLNVLVDMTTHVADIICIGQITFEFINNTLT